MENNESNIIIYNTIDGRASVVLYATAADGKNYEVAFYAEQTDVELLALEEAVEKRVK